MQTYDLKFYEKFKLLRIEHGYSQTQLAQLAGCTHSFVSYIERGKYRTINLPSSLGFARVYKLSLEEFLERIGIIPVIPEIEDVRAQFKVALSRFGLGLEEIKLIMDMIGVCQLKNKLLNLSPSTVLPPPDKEITSTNTMRPTSTSA
jgi:transcriptional regulator with XRE-family HTH domain